MGVFVGSHHETFVCKHIRYARLASIGGTKQASPNFGVCGKHACILYYGAQLLHKFVYLALQSLKLVALLPHLVHIVAIKHLQLFNRLRAVSVGIIVVPYVEEQDVKAVEKLEVLVKIGYLSKNILL